LASSPSRLTQSQFGFDFTVHGNSINVTSLLIYASNNALATSKRVAIFDRSTDKSLLLTAFAAGTPRQPIIPFAQEFVDLQLRPGVYSILVDWNGVDDLCARGFAGTDEKVVRTTAAIVTGSASSSATFALVTNVTAPGEHVGVTFRFSVIPNAPPPPLTVTTDFVDCEAVACAGLPTGEYTVGGRRTFCDNDEAGGGWTRIWRLNDSSCEEQGWTSARNARANGTDPAGCRSGKIGCSSVITWPNESLAELMGKNWAIWSFGTPDSFGSGDGVVVSAESQRLWTFSVTHGGSWNRCPCDPLFFTTDPVILARINATDYICDAGADAGSFAPVFLAGGAKLCSRDGADHRRSFQKVLPEQQRRSAQVMFCLNQEDTDEDIKIGALDLFARKTPRFNKALHCPTTFLPSTTNAATAPATATSTTSGLSSTSSAARQLRPETPPGSNVAVIAGAVGGSIGALLIAATIFFILKRRRRPKPSAASKSAVSSQNEYGQLSIMPAPAGSDYDVGNVLLPPESTAN
jgi:hypothetical protein